MKGFFFVKTLYKRRETKVTVLITHCYKPEKSGHAIRGGKRGCYTK